MVIGLLQKGLIAKKYYWRVNHQKKPEIGSSVQCSGLYGRVVKSKNFRFQNVTIPWISFVMQTVSLVKLRKGISFID